MLVIVIIICLVIICMVQFQSFSLGMRGGKTGRREGGREREREREGGREELAVWRRADTGIRAELLSSCPRP